MTQVIENEGAREFAFKLDGDEQTYSIPLASSLPASMLRGLEGKDFNEFAFDLLDRFCPGFTEREDVTIGTLRSVLTAWNDASAKDGADLGKSRASSEP